jgi:RNA-directed DNA polymerase
MQESYGEGVAIHTGPELCGASREGGLEALVGVRAGRVLSPEISQSGVPTQSSYAEGNILSSESARWTGTPRGRRPRACTETPRTRTGRSQVSPQSPSAAGVTERSGKSKDARR